MKIPRYKDLLYTHADFMKKSGKTLQEHLDGAFKKLSFAADREQRFGQDEHDVRLWNSRATRGLLTCGMFHSWENGRSQLVVQVKKKVTEYVIKATDAPKAKDATTEFNEGLLFFGVHKNHTILLQSGSLRRSAFEDYLNWLLQDATDEIGKENRVALLDRLPRKLRKNGAIPPLKSIILVPPFQTESENPAASANLSQGPVKEMKLKMATSNMQWLREALQGIGGDLPPEMSLDAGFNPERVHIEIQLSWRGRDKDRDETPVLDTIMRSFRDVDDPPIKAITATGAEIRGNELRLRKPNVLIETDGKIPIAGSVFEQMQKYLTELLDSGDIPAV